VVDVGTGTARIAIELARAAPGCRIVATDLAEQMLIVARRNVESAGLGDRIALLRVDAKGSALESASFDAVISNSIVHHIPEPRSVFAEMLRLRAPGGLLFVRDLERPSSDRALAELVRTYASEDTPRQRALFEASLRAALTVDEVAEIAASFGLDRRAVTRTSDRHWTLVDRA
jgi:ubiquinone/menaquinone biosynthesis C-methylase UbiE